MSKAFQPFKLGGKVTWNQGKKKLRGKIIEVVQDGTYPNLYDTKMTKLGRTLIVKSEEGKKYWLTEKQLVLL